jgi:hypothetical protein
VNFKETSLALPALQTSIGDAASVKFEDDFLYPVLYGFAQPSKRHGDLTAIVTRVYIDNTPEQINGSWVTGEQE